MQYYLLFYCKFASRSIYLYTTYIRMLRVVKYMGIELTLADTVKQGALELAPIVILKIHCYSVLFHYIIVIIQ